MIQRLARTAKEEVEYEGSEPGFDRVDNWPGIVRAVLQELRKPTLGMLIAGQSCIYIKRNDNIMGPHTYASRDEFEEAFVAAIDEALSG